MIPPFKAYDGNDDFVFISYVKNDDKVIYPILVKLNNQGLRIWYDEGIRSSEDWRKVLYNKIKKCSTFIVFYTKNSVESPYLNKECLKAAEEYNTRDLPVILAKLENVKIPENVSFEFISLQEDRSYIYGVDYFINHISGSLDKSLWDASIPSDKMDEIIQIYNSSRELLGTTTRKDIHEKHLWHKTVLIFVVHPSGKILYIKRSGRSRINPNLFDCFGGHLKISETYREAARRELAEELALPPDLIVDTDLIQIGEPGQFEGRFTYPSYINYEFSSLYLFFLSEDIIINTQETFGEDVVLLLRDGDFLEDLVKKYNHDKSQFADGISRILNKKKIVKQMYELIDKQKISRIKNTSKKRDN